MLWPLPVDICHSYADPPWYETSMPMNSSLCETRKNPPKFMRWNRIAEVPVANPNIATQPRIWTPSCFPSSPQKMP